MGQAKKQIQHYINNFRRELSWVLRPGIGLSCLVHPALSGGAVLEFKMGQDIANSDDFEKPSPTLPKALSKIKQNSFTGDLDNLHFTGTSMILEQNRIVLIKDNAPSEWRDSSAKKDVNKLLNSIRRKSGHA
ncbi:hypothetical protein [Stenotrophomonas geniculata]|uniref:hypothetical protein n=1 Tax=Stenotrophomonas geniculata TaxID=86188 RepID=UPI00122E01CA|nr:hypothetical protein [Stenotrophomonas geniculata]